MRSYWKGLVVGVILCLISSMASAQLLTGTIAGRVTDTKGAGLPGVTVTVSGEYLIGGLRSLVTDATGGYRTANLPPGAYDVTFSFAGFKTFERKQILINASFVATINVVLEAGSADEITTVTGASPTVDTTSNVQQAIMTQDTLEGVPTGRDPWSLAKIVSGRQVSTYDVGGTQGMQQSGISAHGSRSDDKTFALDGLVVNWPGGGGGSTMVYYDQGMFEEVNYRMSAIPAEVASGGVYMNMVTKSGSNAFRGSAMYYYANEDMQSENFADVSAKYQFPGGNPVKTQFDFNTQVAGPVVRDKVWFFGSYRRWRVDKIWKNSFNPDGTNAIDDNLIWNGAGKISAQITRSQGLNLVYSYNSKNRYHRRATNVAIIDSKATSVQEQPGYTLQAKYLAVLGGANVYEMNIGVMSGVYPERYQQDVGPGDYRREDSVLSTATGSAPKFYENPNYRFQFDNIFSRNISGRTGSHNVKAGVQFARQFYREINRVNGDWRLMYNNGVPFQILAFNSPVIGTSYIHQIGFFGQDSWTIRRRLTLNVGLRFDRAKGFYPDQTSPAGRWVPERSITGKTVYQQWRPAWRAGFVYDAFGSGNTAIKGDYSRYAFQVGIGLVTNVLPFTFSQQAIAWADTNKNGFPDSDELGRFEGFTGAATTRYSDPNGPTWGYSDELSAGVEHQLIKNVRVSAMYYRRTNRKITGSRNAAVPTTAYSQMTTPSPTGGNPITFYNLSSTYVGKQDNVREAIDLLDTNYSGVEITANRRFSARWQMQLGLTAGRNKGGVDLGDFNDPNNMNNQQGIVGDDATYQLKLSGSYQIPKIEGNVSGSFIRNTGYPRHISYNITRAVVPGLTRSSQLVYGNARGDERLPSITMVDLRFSRTIKLGGRRSIDPQVDVFNITNSDAIVAMNNAVGARLGYPTEILGPRIIRVGFTVKF